MFLFCLCLTLLLQMVLVFIVITLFKVSVWTDLPSLFVSLSLNADRCIQWQSGHLMDLLTANWGHIRDCRDIADCYHTPSQEQYLTCHPHRRGECKACVSLKIFRGRIKNDYGFTYVL